MGDGIAVMGLASIVVGSRLRGLPLDGLGMWVSNSQGNTLSKF